MDPKRVRESLLRHLETILDDSQHVYSEDETAKLESPIYSSKSPPLEFIERNVQHQRTEPAKARQVAFSLPDGAPTLSSISVTDLSRQCIAAFETCMHHESLMNHEWAENRSADFNLFVDSIGPLSTSDTSLYSLFESRPDDLRLLKSVLIMLKDFLCQCISCAEAQSNTDAATRKVDSSLENLALIAAAIGQNGVPSHLERADKRFKPEEHKYLRNFLKSICLGQYHRPEAGNVARKRAQTDGYRLSEPQQRLIEVNLRRRNRFLRAQEHSEKLKARQDDEIEGDVDDEAEILPQKEAPSLTSSKKTISVTKPSTAERSLRIRKGKEIDSQPTMATTTTPTAAAQYPNAPGAYHDPISFKCPCCCQNLPAVFNRNNDLRKNHLAQDISPYTCILPDCPMPLATYATVLDWEKHFTMEHRPCRVCPLCENTDATFSGMEDLATHIETEHAEISSPEFVLNAISWSAVTTIGVNICPLCDCTGNEHAPEFVRHVLYCIHDFSLFSLPWADHDQGEARKHEWSYNLERIGEDHQPMCRRFRNREDEDTYTSSFEPDLGEYDGLQAQGIQSTDNDFNMKERKKEISLLAENIYGFLNNLYGRTTSDAIESSEPLNLRKTSTILSSTSGDTFEASVFDSVSSISDIHSPQLLCEFIGYYSCEEMFNLNNVDDWIQHCGDHLLWRLPKDCSCWFCDDAIFHAVDNTADELERNFRARMHHIAYHFGHDATVIDIRPDFYLLNHLLNNGLIAEKDFRIHKDWHEAPQPKGGINSEEPAPSTYGRGVAVEIKYRRGRERRQMVRH